MVVVIAANRAVFDEICCLPSIEGGVGAVLIGDLLEAEDGRVAFAHPLAEVDRDWLAAYTSGENPPLRIVDALPADFIPKGAI
ncbi:MAG: hypothetical protein WC683_05005 [bacterium]